MPRTTQDFRRIIERSWDHVANQDDYDGMVVRLNNTGDSWSATDGWGTSTETSTAAVYCLAGRANMSGECVMRFISPTTAANCSFGIMARLNQLETSGDADYVRFWLSAGTATINQVIGGSIGTNLSSAAFALLVDTDVTFTWSIKESTAIAAITATGVPTAELATDGITLLSPGFMGTRCTGRTMRVKQFTGRLL